MTPFPSLLFCGGQGVNKFPERENIPSKFCYPYPRGKRRKNPPILFSPKKNLVSSPSPAALFRLPLPLPLPLFPTLESLPAGSFGEGGGKEVINEKHLMMAEGRGKVFLGARERAEEEEGGEFSNALMVFYLEIRPKATEAGREGGG